MPQLDYPKMLYGEGGATMIVNTQDQEQAAGPGWDVEPKDEHRTQAGTVQPLQSGQEPFVEAVAVRTAELVLAALKAGADAPPPPVPEAVRKAPRAAPKSDIPSGKPDDGFPRESGE